MSKSIQYRRIINPTEMAQLQDKAALPSSVMPEVRGEGRVRLADEVHHIVPIESVSDVKSMEMRRLTIPISCRYAESAIMHP